MKLVKIVALFIACAVVGINAEWPWDQDLGVKTGLLKTVAQSDKSLGLNVHTGDIFAFKVMQQGDSNGKTIPWVIKSHVTDSLELLDTRPDIPSASKKFAPSTGFVFRADKAGETSVVIGLADVEKGHYIKKNERTLTIKIK